MFRQDKYYLWKKGDRIGKMVVLLVLLQAVLLLAYRVQQPLAAAPIEPADVISGEFQMAHVPHLTAVQRQEIETQLAQNIDMLAAQGKLTMGVEAETPALSAVEAAVSLSWPLQQADGLNDFGYHGVSFFVAHGSQDYSCGSRIYDGHRGTDFFLWPFPWNKVDDNAVQVVAVAGGVIIYKQDGNNDRSCTFNGGDWNAVYVRHADGSVAWYGHMKNGSLTPKSVGETVQTGEYLGVVASSGNSSGPHLHLEVYGSGGSLIDPYQGSCNNSPSWWLAQRPYDDSAVNKLMTGTAAPVIPACPSSETSYEALSFNPGDKIFFSAYFRDRTSSLNSNNTIYRPDNSVFTSWVDTQASAHWDASYKTRPVTIGVNEPTGRWQYEVVFNGTTYRHDFYLGEIPTLDPKVYLPLLIKP